MTATPVASATHTWTVDTFIKTPCQLEVTDYPYDCAAARQHPARPAARTSRGGTPRPKENPT